MPFYLADGFVNHVQVTVPWQKLLQKDSFVEVRGLQLTLRPRQSISPGKNLVSDKTYSHDMTVPFSSLSTSRIPLNSRVLCCNLRVSLDRRHGL